jgi:hypothetical protein
MAKKIALLADDGRRTIAELIARYEVEPTLRDVYVEGDFDAALVSWFLRHHRCDGVVVYTIDTVNVPKDQVISAGLEDGEKGRVICACQQLAAALGHGQRA